MNDAFRRCDNSFPQENVINMYIDGLTPTINSLVQLFRGTQEECTFTEVVQKTKSKGDALRARKALLSRGPKPRTLPVRQIRALNMTQFSYELTYGQPISGYGNAEDHLVDGFHMPASVSSSSILYMTRSRESEWGRAGQTIHSDALQTEGSGAT